MNTSRSKKPIINITLIIVLIFGAVLLWFFLGPGNTDKRIVFEQTDFDAKIFSMLEQFSSSRDGSDELRLIIQELVDDENNDLAIVPLIELLRFSGPQGVRDINNALHDITGEDINDWSQWIDYLSNSKEIVLSPGYIEWKGQRLTIIDPNFQRFFNHETVVSDSFRPELAVWGGVAVAIEAGKDRGIPPLEEPAVVLGSEATFMRGADVVYAMVISGTPRAYPQRIVDWHEMINDVVNGTHFTIAYCTLCGAAIAYDTELPNGDFRTFSSSGLLYQSNKLMFDRQTETLWNHLLGTPVAGPLVGEVDRLPLLPIETTLWSDWIERHPDTQVLDINKTGFNRNYDQGVPSYNAYYESPDTLFPVGNVPGPLQAKDRIFGIIDGDEERAYKRDTIWNKNVINDEINGKSIVIVNEGSGLGIKAFERQGYVFTLDNNSFSLADEKGNRWEITDEALINADVHLARLPAHEAFWFGWILNYPNTTVYR